jgi:hypothetical protein
MALFAEAFTSLFAAVDFVAEGTLSVWLSAVWAAWEEGEGLLFSIVFNKFQIANCSMG